MPESVLFKEPLDGGLVTSRHPTTLRPGELSRADNVYYHPNDPSIRRARGRTDFAGVTGGGAGAVKGTRVCKFDGTVDTAAYDILVAYLDDDYYYHKFASRAPTPDWKTLKLDVGSGPTLDAIHYADKHILLNGNIIGSPNQVVKAPPGPTSNPSTRRHGLKQVNQLCTVTKVAGSWPLDSLYFGEGRYFFFTTEVANPGTDDEVESAYDPNLPPAYVDMVKDVDGQILFGVTVQRHQGQGAAPTPPLAAYQPINTDAAGTTIVTEWRLYMAKAPLYSEWNASLLASAYQVGKGAFGSLAAGYAADIISLSATSTVAGPKMVGTATATVTGDTVVLFLSGILTRYGDSNCWVFGTNGNEARIKLSNFGFTAGEIPDGSAIVGIQVALLTEQPGHGRNDLFFALTPDVTTGIPPTVLTPNKSRSVTSEDGEVFVFGGPTDTWGRTFTPAEVRNANFGAYLVAKNYNWDSGYCVLHWVEITIWTGTSLTIGKPYPVVSVQVGNVTSVVSANTPPPTASTGDVFDGQIVLNDVKDRGAIRYSLPDGPDYFPSIYFVKFQSKENDHVVAIRRVADILIVGLRHQIYRVNYLPRSTDSEFDRGRAYEVLAETHGVVSLQGTAQFTPTNSAPLLAYVSDSGLKATDGQQVLSLTEDIDWDNLVEPTKLNQAILVNYPKLYQLRFFFTPKGGSTNTQYMVIHYHPSHAKEGRKWAITGPCLCSAASAFCARLGNEWVLLTGHNTDGKIWVEDNSDDDNADLGTGIVPLVETRDLYTAGIGYEWTLETFWTLHNSTVPTMTWTLTVRKRNTEGDIVNDAVTKTFTTAKDGLSRLYPHAAAEAMRFRLTCADAGSGNNKQATIAFLAFLGSGHGISER